MALSSASNSMYYISGQSVGNQIVDTPEQESPQASSQQMRVLLGPVAILWDIENCPVPGEVRPEDIAGNIRMALRVHPVVRGAVTMFSAYGDFNIFPRRLREGCQRTGVNLIDVPSGKKDAADKAILVDMLLFALDNPPPSTILLISGDVDFAPALHKLGQRGYTVVLAIPAGFGVSSALCNAGRFVWDWPSVARGEGLIPAKAFLSRSSDVAGYLVGCFPSDDSDLQNEEEAIVYRGIARNEYNIGASSNQIYCLNSKHMSVDLTQTLHAVGECNPESVTRNGNNIMATHASSQTAVPVSRAQGQNSASCMQSGDIQGLKRQLVKLIHIYGGSLLLVRVPSEYHKVFGRPLYLAEYGSCKLVNLIKKMHDSLSIEGKGNRKFLCLRESANTLNRCQQGRVNGDSPTKGSADVVIREECTVKADKAKGIQEYSDPDVCISVDVDAYGTEVHLGHYSDEGSDEERVSEQEDDRNGESIPQAEMNSEDHATEASLAIFKQELQELLVSHACKILLTSFLTLYQQRYARDLDYSIFGVKELEALIEKVRDVAIMKEEQGTKRKFLVANCGFKIDRQ